MTPTSSRHRSTTPCVSRASSTATSTPSAGTSSVASAHPAATTWSPNSGVTDAAALAAHDVAPITFLGMPALAGTVAFDPPATTVYWIREGTYSTATAAEIPVDEIAAIVSGMQPGPRQGWEDHVGVPAAQEAVAGSCAPVTLSISAP